MVFKLSLLCASLLIFTSVLASSVICLLMPDYFTDAFDPTKNGVSDAFDPSKNGKEKIASRCVFMQQCVTTTLWIGFDTAFVPSKNGFDSVFVPGYDQGTDDALSIALVPYGEVITWNTKPLYLSHYLYSYD